MITRILESTYDEEANAGYVYLNKGKEIARTVPLVPEFEGDNDTRPTIVLDFAEDGSLVGIEILFLVP